MIGLFHDIQYTSHFYSVVSYT